ncbi:MAG: serine/threonine-protein kinase [Kofleriaceae bacterium]
MSYQNVETTAPTRLGRFELIGLLAVGGMAEIHLARLAGEAGFEKIVVVKRLLPELVASKAFVAMFLDEGKLVARLDHPNICEVHELGREGAEYFLVMPYLDGVAATELIAQPRDPDRMAQLRVAAGVIVQACAGLSHAHEHVEGLVHRDVSPSNLFVTTKGVVKVLDFGIAKAHGTTATEVGTVKGKTQYMAPEQVMGDAIDRRVDVFALGIVLYELATHQRLFKRSSDYLAAKAILEEPIPRADVADPAIPAALADVIAKALARVPGDRYATAKELAAAIEGAIAVARPDEIAASIAAHHAEELTAQRTRQARVVKSAGTTARTEHPVTVPVTRAALMDVAATGVRPATAPEDVPATPTEFRSETTSSDMQTATATATLSSAPAGSFGVDADAVAVADHVDDNVVTPRIHSRRVAWFAGVGLLVAGAIAVPLFASAPASHVDLSTFVPKFPIEAPQPHVAPPPVETKVETPPVVVDKRPKQHPTSRPKQTTAAAQPIGTGFFSMDAHPFAEVFVDGHSLGVTPLVHKPLPAGTHQVRAVRSDGTAKTFSINIAQDKTTAPAFSW